MLIIASRWIFVFQIGDPSTRFDFGVEFLGSNGFGEIIVHPGFETQIAIPFIALAVMATMGKCLPRDDSRSRISRVASSPSMTGICMSR
jgi:hypothetical protein